MIQFARAVFPETSLCLLEFSVTYRVIFSGVLFCFIPSSNCFAGLTEGQVSSILTLDMLK